jgi:hypothetical protein
MSSQSIRGHGQVRGFTTKKSWVQTLTVEIIVHAPFIWIKEWTKRNYGKFQPNVHGCNLQIGGWTLMMIAV